MREIEIIHIKKEIIDRIMKMYLIGIPILKIWYFLDNEGISVNDINDIIEE